LSGIQTSYGKGLSPEAARASCLMEIVERVCSFASIDDTRLPDYKKAYSLITGSYQELRDQGLSAIDPSRMILDAPYHNERLHWMPGQDVNGAVRLVPVQAVFLFANLDEVNLLSNLGSTGLASGNTMEEAKIAGLLEVIERDADGVVPFDTRTCFELYTENPNLLPLFEAYQAQGIQIRFQEVTTEFGIPCYRCFVVNEEGQIIRGTGANLDGRRAIMSALTETTFPFPGGPASAPGLAGLPKRRFEDLPNFDTNSSHRNLALIETLLTSRGYSPVYVDLTRRDIDIPVVKALVPGLDWLAEFDRFSRINPRLFANYLKRGDV
jgi:ribosomal protein S12 methylthiotransferase accessory factor